MQFIPSTWSVVGVDADGDGKRDPQDVDDAALATAVYLCSGTDDLVTTAGQRSAIHRYNHSRSYVDLVLSIMEAYLDGDFTSVPNSTTSATFVLPDSSAASTGSPAQPGPRAPGTGSAGSTGNQGGDDHGPSDPQPSTAPSGQPTTAPSGAASPTRPPGGGDGGSQAPSTPKPPAVTVPALPSTTVEPVDEVLTHAQAVLQCTLDGYVDNPLRSDDPFDRCVDDYTNG